MAHQAIGPGSVVASRFRLEDLLDEHSGARFWRATDLTLARNVAIHIVSVDDPRAAALLTAARTSATVADAHLLRVLDAVEEGDLVHVVHEWGSGVSLDRMLSEETLDPRRAAWLVREVAEALTVAHRHGIAHGRLLPENVMVTDAGAVKLIGFVVDAVLHGRQHRPTDTLPAPTEHESDVLNLGALLYAALTGKWAGFPESVLPDAPFDHTHVYRPRRVRAGIPKALDALCDEILNGDPHAHGPLESAAGIAAALGEFLGEGPGPAFALTSPDAFLDLDAVERPTAPGTLGSFDGIPDPEATQAGVPMWTDHGTGRAVTDDASDDDSEDTADHSDLQATQAAPVVARATPRDDADVETTRRSPVVAPVSPESGTDPDPAPESGTDTDRHRVLGTGMGGGVVPPYWGPDSPEDSGTWPAQDQHTDAPGSTWLRLGVLVGAIVLVVLAAIVALSLAGRDIVPGTGGDSDEPTTSPSPAPTPVQATVSDFDPSDQSGSGPSENPELVPLATDGDKSTAWTTSQYFDGPKLAPYKPGVGLLLDLGDDVAVTDVVTDLVGQGYSVQLLAAPEGTTAAPTSTEGLTTVTSRQGVGGRVVLAGDEPVTTRYLVLWLTALPETSSGRFQGSVAEVAARS